jgi:DNA polymerase III gamma/tau subunit
LQAFKVHKNGVKTMLKLYEKHRPKTWQDVIGQEKAVARLLKLRDASRLAGNVFWISGASGTGKTTIARLLALEVADEFCIEELDSQDLTPAKLNELENSWNLYGWGKGGRAYLVNESHGLRADSIRKLLTMLERMPSHVIMVFTTTSESMDTLLETKEDANPLLSRCIQVALSRQGLSKPFAEHARNIAMAEGLDGLPIEKYVQLAQRHKNNMRGMFQDIESGAMA